MVVVTTEIGYISHWNFEKCGLKVWFGMKDLILDYNALGCGMTDMPSVLFLWLFIVFVEFNDCSLTLPKYEEERRLLLSYAHIVRYI